MTLRALQLTLSVLFASYRKRYWEPLLVMMALITGCIGFTAVSLVAEGNQAQRIQQQNALHIHGQLRAAPGAVLTKEAYAQLRLAGLSSFVAMTDVTLFNASQQPVPWRLWAIDMMGMTAMGPNAGPVVWAHANDIANIPLPIMLDDGTTLPPLVADDRLPEGVLVVDMGWFYQQSRTLERYPLSALLWVGKPPSIDEQRRLEALPSTLVWQPQQVEDESGTLPDSFVLNLWAMAALMAVVCGIIVVNAIHLLYRSRLPTLTVLRQLGVGATPLTLVLIIEMLMGLTLASALGLWLGYQITLLLTPSLAFLFKGYAGGASDFFTSDMLYRWLRLWGIGAVAVTVLLVLPLRQLKTALLMRHTASRGQVPWTRLAVLVSIGALVSFYMTQTLFMAFVTIALLLVSGCLWLMASLPPLLAWVHRRLPAQQVMLYWCGAEARVLSARLRIALCAFFLAMTANLGMQVMVDSFRLATEQWLAQRLVAPVYGYSTAEQDISDAPFLSAPAFARYVAQAQLVHNNTSSRVEVVSLPQQPDFARSIILANAAPTVMDGFFAGDGLLVSQQLAFRHRVKPGDTVKLVVKHKTAAEVSTEYRVLGVYSDFGNLQPQVMLPIPAVKPYAEPPRSYAFFADIAMLKTLFEQQGMSIDLMSKESLYQNAMRVFDNTFVLTDGLNFITLCVAALSFFISISLLALDRQQQLSLLRALGVSAKRIKLALALQFSLLCLVTGVLALPFAALLSWCLVNHINLYAFGWHYPLHIDMGHLAYLLLVSIAAMALLLALPLGRLVNRLNTRGNVSL